MSRLLTLKQEEWGDKVTVVSSDMRNWVAPEKVGKWLLFITDKTHFNQNTFVTFVFHLSLRNPMVRAS